VLVLGDGPTYRGLAKRLWNRFNGLRVCCHYMRHDPHVVISIDTRSFQKKESRALGRILQAFRFTKITSKDYVIYVCVCVLNINMHVCLEGHDTRGFEVDLGGYHIYI
jgi:hypothetical protein